MAKKPLNRIKEFRESKKLSMADLANAIGTTPSQINKLEKGQRKLTDLWLGKLTAALDCSADELLGKPTIQTELPLWGYVGAGELVHPFDGDDPPDSVDAPPGLKNGAALIVRGDSMLPRLQDGDVIFFEMGEVEPSRLLNEECVVRVKDGARLVKRLTRGTRRNRFHLVSINPAVPVMEDQVVEWAAAIQWIRKRAPKR